MQMSVNKILPKRVRLRACAALRAAPLLLGVLAGALLQLPHQASADVTLPSLISDHMVLQRSGSTRVWGQAEAGEAVTVSVGGVSARSVAAADGHWEVLLDLSQSAAGPFTMEIAGRNRIALRDVMVGQVWFISGQSNMAFTLKDAGAVADVAQSASREQMSLVRHFKISTAEKLEPQSEFPAGRFPHQWSVASPQTIGSFSAVGWYFARRLSEELGVPVGIINASYPGTRIVGWISEEGFAPDAQNAAAAKKLYDTYQQYVLEQEAAAAAATAAAGSGGAANAGGASAKPQVQGNAPRVRFVPSLLSNAMVNPATPFTISGVLWYQGEEDAWQSWNYRRLLPLLIADWRSRWGLGDIPFYICQLPVWGERAQSPKDANWAEMREAQAQALSLPETGLAVLVDTGETGNIHPPDKRLAGERLAALALRRTYGRDVADSGPVYASMQVEGRVATLRFSDTGGGLLARELPATYCVDSQKGLTAPLELPVAASSLQGFAICGQDRKWVWAQAQIDGDTVRVWSDAVARPLAVRYAWGASPVCNLYGANGLPAAPFRTDDFPLSTLGRRF